MKHSQTYSLYPVIISQLSLGCQDFIFQKIMWVKEVIY